jgi:diaminopimelate epimerase
MSRLDGRSFVKMTGGGNDFVVFDNRDGWFPVDGRRDAIARLCRRGLGVGADAVLLLEDDAGLDFRMVYFNADGGEAPMCGNGALCIARYARMAGIVTQDRMVFATGSGPFKAEVLDPARPRVTLWLVPPRDLMLDVPELARPPYVRLGYLDTSTPHVIALLPSVEAVEAHDLMGEGRRLRMDPRWEPPGTNANFIAVMDGNRIRLRTYERGVEGETLSCGTGSTAAAILTSLWGLTKPPVVVETTGGIPLTVDWTPKPGGALPTDPRLTGDARVVYRGVIEGE